MEARRIHPRLAGFLDSVTSQSESGNRDFTANGQPVVSPKGAAFAMQVMPGTAGDPGFGVTPARGRNPQEFNRVGREYRAAMQKRYGGDLAKMWAAYNWGPGNVDKAISRLGEQWWRALPAETLAYVRRNLAQVRGR